MNNFAVRTSPIRRNHDADFFDKSMLKLGSIDGCIRSIPSAKRKNSILVTERGGVVTPDVKRRAFTWFRSLEDDTKQ